MVSGRILHGLFAFENQNKGPASACQLRVDVGVRGVGRVIGGNLTDVVDGVRIQTADAERAVIGVIVTIRRELPTENKVFKLRNFIIQSSLRFIICP